MKYLNPGISARKMTHFYYAATAVDILLLFFGLIHPVPFGYLGAGSMNIAFVQVAFPDNEWISFAAVCWFLGFPILLTIAYIVTLVRKRYKLFCGILLIEVSTVIIYSIWCFAQHNTYGGAHFLAEGLFSMGYWYIYHLAQATRCGD